VAVLPDVPESAVRINPADLDWKFTLAQGAGGQHVQKNQTAVQLTHRPTGTRIRCQNERSQYQNKLWALEILRSKLAEREQGVARAERNDSRRKQVGSGQRGDKLRTIRTQDNTVRCERTGRVKPYRVYANGEIEF
jgi:peptide chain release factor 1